MLLILIIGDNFWYIVILVWVLLCTTIFVIAMVLSMISLLPFFVFLLLSLTVYPEHEL